MHPRTPVRTHAHAPSEIGHARAYYAEMHRRQLCLVHRPFRDPGAAVCARLSNRIVRSCPRVVPIRTLCPPRLRRSTQAPTPTAPCCATRSGRCSTLCGPGRLAVRWRCGFLRTVRFSASKVRRHTRGTPPNVVETDPVTFVCSPPAGCLGRRGRATRPAPGQRRLAPDLDRRYLVAGGRPATAAGRTHRRHGPFAAYDSRGESWLSVTTRARVDYRLTPARPARSDRSARIHGESEERQVPRGDGRLSHHLDPAPARPAGRVRCLRRLGARRRGGQAHLLRALRAAAPRPGGGRHRRQRRHAAWWSTRISAWSPRSSTSRPWPACAATSRSGTPATPPPAGRTGRTPSRRCGRPRPGPTGAARPPRSRWPTTATWSTPPSSPSRWPSSACSTTPPPTRRW